MNWCIRVHIEKKFLSFILLLVVSTISVSADTFSEFGIIRANIAQYCSGHRWLVCFEPKRFPETSEVVGFDAAGSIFRIRGDLRPDAKNLLSLESYEKLSIAFSTKEGYFYIWNPGDDGNPFEAHLDIMDYGKLIKKLELYPLLKTSKDAPLSFELLERNPEFYDRALALPRPKSGFHLENPTARRTKVGIYLASRSDSGSLVQSVDDSSAAAAAGIKPRDVITKFIIDGENYGMEKDFPLPDDSVIRIVSLKISRQSEDAGISFSDVNIFPPSALEYFLFRK